LPDGGSRGISTMDAVAAVQAVHSHHDMLLRLHQHLDAVETRLRASDEPAAGDLHALDAGTQALHAEASGLDASWAGALGTLLRALHSAHRAQRIPGPMLVSRLLAATERTRKKLPPPAHAGTVSRM